MIRIPPSPLQHQLQKNILEGFCLLILLGGDGGCSGDCDLLRIYLTWTRSFYCTCLIMSWKSRKKWGNGRIKRTYYYGKSRMIPGVMFTAWWNTSQTIHTQSTSPLQYWSDASGWADKKTFLVKFTNSSSSSSCSSSSVFLTNLAMDTNGRVASLLVCTLERLRRTERRRKGRWKETIRERRHCTRQRKYCITISVPSLTATWLL